MKNKRNTCCYISLGCLIAGVIGTIVSVFLLFNYFSLFQLYDRTEAEVFQTQGIFLVLTLIFVLIFNAGWIFLIPARIRKESKPFLFILLGIYLAIIFFVICSLRFGVTIPFAA